MDTISLVIGGIGLVFILRGAWRGFGGELAPLVGLVACAGVLWFAYPPLHSALGTALPSLEAKACVFYAATITALIGFGLFFLVAKLVRSFVGVIFPQPFNAILGAGVGAAKAVLLISVVAGLISVAQDRLAGIRERTEANPVSSAAAHFWSERFTAIIAEAEAPEESPTHAEP